MKNNPAPQMITHEELKEKLQHCAEQLSRDRKGGILIIAEGAVRWLTGMRHQVTDIAADAASPVNVLARMVPGGFDLTFVAAHTELPRLKDRIPEVFRGQGNVELQFTDVLPRIDRTIAVPRQRTYSRILGTIVRPIIGGFEGNQFSKLKWLSASSTAALVESARQIHTGMNGFEVRNIAQQNLGRRGIETNLILVALKGQEGHFHPLYEECYSVADDCWVKLVCGARYSELIVSASVMVKFGAAPTEEENLRYRALQEATIEYADCYREGMSDAQIYGEIYRRFQDVGKGSAWGISPTPHTLIISGGRQALSGTAIT